MQKSFDKFSVLVSSNNLLLLSEQEKEQEVLENFSTFHFPYPTRPEKHCRVACFSEKYQLERDSVCLSCSFFVNDVVS